MSFRNWLLTGTSALVLAAAPVSVARAQDASDPAVQAAYQVYQADQSDANRDALQQACLAAGFQSLDDCLAALRASEQQAAPPPAEESAPPPAEETPPPPAEEAAPPPAEETPPPVTEEPPPPPIEEPSSSSSEEPPPPPPPSVEEEAAPPAAQQAAPPAEEAPPPPSEEAAPPSVTEQAPPPPETSSSEAPDVLAQLQAAVALYNQGVAELAAGDAGGQAKIDQASAQIDAICQAANIPDRTACLAQFGLELDPLPAPAAPPASSAEQPAPPPPAGAASEQPPAGGTPGQPPTGEPGGAQPPDGAQPPAGAPPDASSSSEQPIAELPGANATVDENAVEPLPADVAAEAAPVLDSQKPAPGAAGPGGGQPPAGGPGQPGQPPAGAPGQPSSSSLPPPTEPAAPPPQTDQAAQQNIQPPPPADQSAATEQGTRNDQNNFRPPPPQGPDVTVVNQPPGNTGGIVFQIGINLYIKNVEQERDRYYDPQEDEIYYEDLPGGRTREVVERPNGVRIVTIYDRNGDVLKRTKVLPDGREYYLASYDRDEDEDDDGRGAWRDPGDDLPPLRLTIPVREYILDADTADEDEVEEFLDQPPVEEVRRIYSIDEVKRSARLRDSVRRLEVGGLTFDTGKATISRDQVDELADVANAMLRLLDRNPAEVFLIEGHTDTVGSDVSNLVLSDQRAATVARILTDFYEVPAENLVTQGYGERYLKVQVEGNVPENRRVNVKRITPLVSYEAGAD